MTLDAKRLRKAQKATLESIMRDIDEKERKRRSLPKPELSEIEYGMLISISEGRSKDEIDGTIKFYASTHNYRDSYNSLTRRLINKFEANTLAQVIYKAMKVGIIE